MILQRNSAGDIQFSPIHMLSDFASRAVRGAVVKVEEPWEVSVMLFLEQVNSMFVCNGRPREPISAAVAGIVSSWECAFFLMAEADDAASKWRCLLEPTLLVVVVAALVKKPFQVMLPGFYLDLSRFASRLSC